jgi:[CysO sulfur-carrier protein]-S-L-cysteine hydrolase
VRLSAAQRDQLIEHARAEAPLECCGYMRLADGAVAEIVRASNPLASRYGYELDSASLLAANELDEAGHGVAIYHSHPKSPAEPSQTDVNLAFYPHWVYVIVSLLDEPDVRAWRIEDGRVAEEPVELA